jgi:uncharacterized protein
MFRKPPSAAVVDAAGRTICDRCSIADTFVRRLRGLLGRPALAPGEGLLLSPGSSVHTFFMRFPIDAVFLDRGLRVVHVSSDMRPWRLAGCRRSRSVLELQAGEARRRGIRTGDELQVVGSARAEA